MALIQLCAADLAAIDELHYHTYDSAGTRAYTKAREWYAQWCAGDGAHSSSSTATTATTPSTPLPTSNTVEALLLFLYQRKYQWGISDGN